MAKDEELQVEIQSLSEEDLESVSGGSDLMAISNTGSGTCIENSGTGTCKPA